MRVCPKCEYVDNMLWRGSLKMGINWMPLSDFETVHPEIAEKIRRQKFVEEGVFVYHLTKGMNVERQAIIENPLYFKQWHLPIERGNRKGRMGIYSKIMLRKKQEKKSQSKLFEEKEK